ncbi:MAG: tyrosine-type recombinase/integrase [Proteobacteria bacterium]|nr:tyrosine-type recombinase/integrase [Pseudomonadota bacterium]MBU2431941.1 tyrosine-type recombinase/integrase [Pseudomonadota bacterium]MBU2452916.1 tyrosine-type recombinase/integrase [Pseudomonadota bacterium]MBU2627506.1 tyrosine-type recombinase/integrase [Pseudomonadota bacterium]
MNQDLISGSQKNVSVFKALQQIPEELLWKANFNSNNSIETYDKAIHSFLSFIGISSPEELREINHGHVIAFKKYLQDQGNSPRTINNRLSAISSLFNHLIDKQVVKINVAQGIRRMRVNSDRVEAKVLSPEEVRKMLDIPDPFKLQGIRDKAILSTLFFTGCRVSEVCTLKVKDFYQEQGFYVLDFWVKGGKRNRLAIHNELQIALREYLRMAGHENEKDSFLFLPVKPSPKTSDKKRKLSRKTIDYLFNKYAKLAVLDGVTPHSARATFITQALENNCPIEAVQKTVGHSQIKTTQMYDKRVAKYRESASFAVRY